MPSQAYQCHLVPAGSSTRKLTAQLFAGRPAHGELHHHDGQAQDDEEHEVHQHERRAAVLSGNIGEAPYVADADGTPGRNEQKAQPRGKFFSFFHNPDPSFSFSDTRRIRIERRLCPA